MEQLMCKSYWATPGLITNKKTPEQILELVSKKLLIPIEDLKLRTRKQDIVDARRICIHLIKDQGDLSLEKIGKIFKQDHATVLHALRTYDALIINNKEFRNKANKVTANEPRIYCW